MALSDQFIPRYVDMTDQFNTELTPQQERAFRAWKAKLPKDLQNEQDYDLRGAFLAAAKADGRLHMTDRFKKPNHPTFSSGSQYASAQFPAGMWLMTGQRNPVNPSEDQWVYWGSPTTRRFRSMATLRDYFTNAEPGNIMIYPSDYNLPRGK